MGFGRAMTSECLLQLGKGNTTALGRLAWSGGGDRQQAHRGNQSGEKDEGGVEACHG